MMSGGSPREMGVEAFSAQRLGVRVSSPAVARVGIAALNGLLTIQFGLLTVGLPLWVTGHTRAPAATVAALLVINTAFVALFQVRAARLATDIRTAGRVGFAAACALTVA